MSPPFADGRIMVENLHGERVSVRLVVNSRARRISLRIDSRLREGVAIAPNKRALKDAASFAHSRADWLVRALKAVPAASPFADGAMLPLRGVPSRILYDRGEKLVRFEDGSPPLVRVGGMPEALPGRVRRFLQTEALKDIRAALLPCVAVLGRKAGPIRVKDMRSRWGSCAHDGAMSFSWRLILAPPDVLTYVAAHEAAHLVEMNHGPKFWALVARLYGDSGPARAFLRQHGASIQNYGRTGEPAAKS